MCATCEKQASKKATKFVLFIGSEQISPAFKNRHLLDAQLRIAVDEGLSPKKNISIMDLDDHDNLINQFCGEIRHYLPDWDHMFGTQKGEAKAIPQPAELGIQTPKGIIKAVLSTDTVYPGIYLSVNGKVVASVEYNDMKNDFVHYAWKHGCECDPIHADRVLACPSCAELDDVPSVFMQECECCQKRFRVQYVKRDENDAVGNYHYVDEPCECESSFSPVDGAPSIAQWLESKQKAA